MSSWYKPRGCREMSWSLRRSKTILSILTMYWTSLIALALVAPSQALIRFGCSQLVVDRLDPLVEPGNAPSAHIHQIIGGNSFVPDMRPEKMDPAKLSTCTTCQPADDFSNYWTAPIYFKARNGTYKRVPQKPNSGFEGANGGMTVYYMQNQLADFAQKSKVKAFPPVKSLCYILLTRLTRIRASE
jgi:hypothetical protein